MSRTSNALLLSVVLLLGCAGTREWLDEPVGENTLTQEQIDAGVVPEGATRGDVTGIWTKTVLGLLGLGALGFAGRQVLKTKRSKSA